MYHVIYIDTYIKRKYLLVGLFLLNRLWNYGSKFKNSFTIGIQHYPWWMRVYLMRDNKNEPSENSKCGILLKNWRMLRKFKIWHYNRWLVQLVYNEFSLPIFYYPKTWLQIFQMIFNSLFPFHSFLLRILNRVQLWIH